MGVPERSPNGLTRKAVEVFLSSHPTGLLRIRDLADLTGYSPRKLRYGRPSQAMFEAGCSVHGVSVTGGGAVRLTREGFMEAAMAVGLSEQVQQQKERLLAETEARKRKEEERNIAESRRLHESLRDQLTLPDNETVVLADSILLAYQTDRGRTLRSAHIPANFQHYQEAQKTLLVLGNIHPDPRKLDRLCEELQQHLETLITDEAGFLKENILIRELLSLFTGLHEPAALRTQVDLYLLTPYKKAILAKFRALQPVSLPLFGADST